MTFDEEVAAGLRFPAGDPRYGQYRSSYGLGPAPMTGDDLLTGPAVDVRTYPGLGSILQGIASVVTGGLVPFPGGGSNPITPLLPLPGATTATPTTPQLPAIVTSAALQFPQAAKWVAIAWKALSGGAAIASVVQFIQDAIPTTQETATAVVAKAIRTRGGRRRMNPLNPYALRRAMTRINRFDKFADAAEKQLRKYARRR